MKKINLPGGETYSYGVDDHCMVIATEANVVWLSKEMCQWIGDHYKSIIEEEETTRVYTENEGWLEILRPFKFLRGSANRGKLMGYARDEDEQLYGIFVTDCSASESCCCAARAERIDSV